MDTIGSRFPPQSLLLTFCLSQTPRAWSRDPSGHAWRRRTLSGSGRPTSARCDPELAKGFGACRREGSCRRSDGGGRIGFLSPLRVFRFAGHDAHGSATYITCGSSAEECLPPYPRILQLGKGRSEMHFQGVDMPEIGWFSSTREGAAERKGRRSEFGLR